MADDDDEDLVDDQGKKSSEGDQSGPPVKLATKKERNKPATQPAQRSIVQEMADPDIWNSEPVRKARQARWYSNTKKD